MATISYRIRKSKSEYSTIYAHLRIPGGRVVELSTTLSVLPEQWSASKQLAKNTIAENKKLNSNLVNLRKHLINKLNDTSSGLITSSKIKQWIFDCFNRVSEDKISSIYDFTRQFLELSPDLKPNTVKGYKNLLVTLEQYENTSGYKFYLEEITRLDLEKLINWMKKEKGLSQSTISSHFKNIKSLLNKAYQSGIQINPLAREIKVATKDVLEAENKVVLNYDEYKKLKELTPSNKMLENALKWLLIGLNIGQRGGDLLKLTPSDVRVNSNGLVLVDIVQEKTGKYVTIPVKDAMISKILCDSKLFPHNISLQKLNVYIKKVCEEALIDELFEGYIRDENNKKIFHKGPKYLFITSHCMRRSFATHYYSKIPTPAIMGITGHKRESTFLTYINKHQNRDDNAELFASYMK